jgi:hypothetical protein
VSAVEYARTDQGVSISELENLIGVYGEIDEAAARDDDLRRRVAELLPPYGGPVNWFGEFRNWMAELAEVRGTEPPRFPSLREGLRNLGDDPSELPGMRGRRLFTVAVVMQAYPEGEHPEGDLTELAQRVLRFEVQPDGEEGVRTRDLLRRLTELPGEVDAGWERVVFRSGLVRDPEEVGPPMCASRLVMVDHGPGRGPVATLTTEFESDIPPTFDEAIRFLHPENWPHCNSLWCEMRPLGDRDGVYKFHEVFSLDCARRPRDCTIEADLDFRFQRLDHVAIADYRLSDPQPGDDVLVDEGSLVVQEVNGRLRITTTKRVEFNHPFSGEQLALIACINGYGDVARDLFSCCAHARLQGRDDAGIPFPGEEPPAAGGQRRPARRPGEAGSFTKITDDAAAALKQCLDDCAVAVQDWSTKVAEGRYTADELVRDMTDAWTRMMREGAAALDLVVRSAQAAGPRREPDDQPPDHQPPRA